MPQPSDIPIEIRIEFHIQNQLNPSNVEERKIHWVVLSTAVTQVSFLELFGSNPPPHVGHGLATALSHIKDAGVAVMLEGDHAPFARNIRQFGDGLDEPYIPLAEIENAVFNLTSQINCGRKVLFRSYWDSKYYADAMKGTALPSQNRFPISPRYYGNQLPVA